MFDTVSQRAMVHIVNGTRNDTLSSLGAYDMKNSLSVYLNNTDVLSSDFHTAKDRSLFLCQVLREIQLCENFLDLIDLNSTYGNGKVQASRFLTVFHRCSQKLPDQDKITILFVCTFLVMTQKNVLEKLNALEATKKQKEAIFNEMVWRLKLLFSNGSKAANVSLEKEYSEKHPICIAAVAFIEKLDGSGSWLTESVVDYMNKLLKENDPPRDILEEAIEKALDKKEALSDQK